MPDSASGRAGKSVVFLAFLGQIFFLSSLFFLIFEIRLVLIGGFVVNSGSLFFLSVIFWIAELAFGSPDFKKFFSSYSGLWIAGLLILAGCFLSGLINNQVGHPLWLTQILRLVSNILAAGVVAWYYSSPGILKKWLPIIICTPVVLFPLLYFLDSNIFLVTRYYIFKGLTENSSLFSLYVLPATVIFYLLFIKSASGFEKILFFLLNIISWTLLLSSDSRIGWLAAVIGSCFCVVVTSRNKPNILKLQRIAVLSAVMVLGFSILPVKLKLVVLSRFSPAAEQHLYGNLDNSLRDASDIQKMKVALSWSDFRFDLRKFLSLNGRDHIWNQALKRILRSPFGSGLTYSASNPFNNGSLESKTTHNIFLESLTVGGLLAFVGLLILFLSSIGLPNASTADSWLAASLGVSAALWFAMLGSDGILLRWFWIILGFYMAAATVPVSSRRNGYAYRSGWLRFLAGILDYLGYGLTFYLRRNRKIEPSRIRNILIIKLDHLGDCFLMTPFPAKLKQLFPRSEVDVVCQKNSVPIFENNPFIRRVFSYDYARAYRGPEGGIFNISAFWRFIRAVRGSAYDLVIDPRGVPFAAFVSFLSGARYRIGFEREEYGGFLYSHPLRYDPSLHETEKYKTILSVLGLPETGEWQPRIFLTGPENDKISNLINNGINGRFLVVHPGAGAEYKRWPPKNFAEVLNGLSAAGVKSVLMGTVGEKKINEEIASLVANGSVLDLSGKLSIRESYGLISFASGFLGSDSVLGHMAGALGIPAVIVMSPVVSGSRWRPLGSDIRIVSGRAAGHDCAYARCPYPCPHMGSISVSEVLKETKEILS